MTAEIQTDVAQFGGGARQEAEVGLNAERVTSSWSWHLAKADIDTIVTKAKGDSGFQFTSPLDNEPLKYKCLRRRRREVPANSDRLECEFEQIFGP